MYSPAHLATGLSSNPAAVAVAQPAAVGDKQLVYLIVTNTAAGDVALTKTGLAQGPFVVAQNETWMAGPVLGSDIPAWGLASYSPQTGSAVMFLAGDLVVDARTRPVSVHDSTAVTPAVPFVWQQLIAAP